MGRSMVVLGTLAVTFVVVGCSQADHPLSGPDGTSPAGLKLAECQDPAAEESFDFDTILAVGRAEDGTTYVVDDTGGNEMSSSDHVGASTEPRVFVSEGGPFAGTEKVGSAAGGPDVMSDALQQVAATFETRAGETWTVAIGYWPDGEIRMARHREETSTHAMNFGLVLAEGEELTVLPESEVCFAFPD